MMTVHGKHIKSIRGAFGPRVGSGIIGLLVPSGNGWRAKRKNKIFQPAGADEVVNLK
jgi:hypothetical protein